MTKKGSTRSSRRSARSANEFVLAVKNGVTERTTEEAADLLFHILVALRAADVDLHDVIDELERRRK